MSIYFPGKPVANQQFRDVTARMKSTMLNVTTIPRRCKCVRCGKMRTEATGKNGSSGFVCGMCSSGNKVR